MGSYCVLLMILFWLIRIIFCSIQVTTLSNVEAKKRFEFLEAVSGTMDAHLRYFKQVSCMQSFSFGFHIFAP